MAGAIEAIALSNSVCQCMNQIQSLGNNWYKATEEWQQFPQQVKRLEIQLEFWKTESSNRGLFDAALNQSLLDAELLLKKEQRRLEKRAARCGAGCCPRACTAVFPARLGLRVEATINAFNDIPGMLEWRAQARAALDRACQTVSFSERITQDSRYVRLKDSETHVYNALDNPQGPVVVLLHGGPGKGKSTLARNTMVHYKEQSDQPRFDHVFFLTCGPEANVEDTLSELIHRLGSELNAAPDDNINTRSIRIRKHIRGLLTVQKVLIILDDVFRGEFLAEIVQLCGSRVKCLVTSQVANLCRSLDISKFVNIKIQDIELEDARKILASHVGLPNQQIPENVQKVADRMISETESNPLALASLANCIDPNRSSELKEWEDASTSFFHALDEKVNTCVFDQFDARYLKSFWLTTRVSIDSLRQESRKLFFLLHACQGPSVPEEVIQVLFESLRSQRDTRAFSVVRCELENKQLIKITNNEALATSSNPDEVERQRSWSLHSLHKLYIEREMRKERDSIFTSLFEKDNETDNLEGKVITEIEELKKTVVIALCALYLDEALANVAATKINIPLERFDKDKRQVIEPITILLAHPVRPGQWTEIEQVSAWKVFLRYVCHDGLDDRSASHLLGVQVGVLSMHRVLKAIIHRGRSLQDEDTRGIVNVLIGWFVNDEWSTKEAALETLGLLAYQGLHCLFIVSFPGVLQEMARLLQEGPPPSPSSEMRTKAAIALSMLVAHPNVDEANQIRVKIMDHPGIVLELGNILCNEADQSLQQYAILAFARLALGSDEVIVKFVHCSRALSGLVNMLSNTVLQVYPVSALCNLAEIEDDNTRLTIKATKGVIEGLICLLDTSNLEWVVEHAMTTITLLDLARGNSQHLRSHSAYLGRSYANFRLEHWMEAVADLDKAHELRQASREEVSSILRARCFVRAKMGDYEGALEDAESFVSSGHDPYQNNLQERGVVKRMMDNLDGALVDLNEGLALVPNNYEMLKHRGYVKFLMRDEEGARVDADWALRIKPSHVDDTTYGKRKSGFKGRWELVSGFGILSLGQSSVEYLSYKLK